MAIRYHLQRLAQYNGNGIDFDTDTIKVALFTNSYVPDATTDEFFSDISANEVTGDGYTAGGETLTTKTVTVNGTGVVTFDADDVIWFEGATGFINARFPVFYKDTGNPATSPLFVFHDFTVDRDNDDNDLQLVISTLGIFRSGLGTIT